MASNIHDSDNRSSDSDLDKSPTKRIWVNLFRSAIFLTVLFALVFNVRSSANQFKELDFDIASIDFRLIVMALGSYFCAMLLSCAFWFMALRALGCSPRLHQVVLAFFASQLGKYVPGKAMVVIIRTDLIRGKKVNTVSAAASVFVETLTWIFVGSVIAALLIVIRYPDHLVLKWTAIGLAIFAGILTVPPIFKKIATKLTGRKSEIFDGLNFGTMTFGWILMSIGWCLNAFSLFLVIDSLPNTNVCWEDFGLALACVSLACVAGFASLLPGGLGVRELVMLPLLGPRFGTATALIAAVLIRIVWITAELVSSGIIYLMLQFWSNNSSGK